MKIYQLVHFSCRKKEALKEPFLIIGLGNPGKKYIDTRHNVGFEMLDAIAAAENIKVTKTKFRALIGEGKINEHGVILAKPQTYMNLSGECVRDIAAYYKIPNEKIIIIYDDIALNTGSIRIRPKGSAGGHNGMKNIIYHLKSDEFPRIRVGIGPPAGDVANYVLNRFSKEEISVLTEIAKNVPDIVNTVIASGVETAMNRYNSVK